MFERLDNETMACEVSTLVEAVRGRLVGTSMPGVNPQGYQEIVKILGSLEGAAWKLKPKKRLAKKMKSAIADLLENASEQNIMNATLASEVPFAGIFALIMEIRIIVLVLFARHFVKPN